MIDLAIIRDDSNRIRTELKKRGMDVDFKKLIRLDGLRREYQKRYDETRAQQKGVKDAAAGKKLKAALKKIEAERRKVDDEFGRLSLQLPNFAADDVPKGKDESGNVPGKPIGKKPDIKNPKPHYEIPGIKPLIDFERGAKVSGNRFWFLKGALVQLEFALTRYALDFYEKKDFVAMRPPTIVRREAMLGTGFFPTESSEIYMASSLEMESDVMRALGFKDKEAAARAMKRLDKEGELFLSGTAEVPLASYHAGETLKELPVKYIGFAPAFRREAGSYGQDTKGILRGHEFDKLELFVFAAPEKSWDVHEALQVDAEAFWSSLKIPFQVVNICTGDLGAPNAKKLDIEAWLPGEGRYREVASNSNDTDFQARRLKIKSNGQLVHTLNNTACAIGRTIVAIAENYQRDDGSVDMPDVLHPYLPFKRITNTGGTE